jgi:hypothetical protein
MAFRMSKSSLHMLSAWLTELSRLLLVHSIITYDVEYKGIICVVIYNEAIELAHRRNSLYRTLVLSMQDAQICL